MIGISIYLSDIDESYIKEAARCGVRYVFTSLHIPEEDLSDLDQSLPRLLKIIKENNMILIPDISPFTFEKLNLENGDFAGLRDMGFERVRLDFGFEDVSVVCEIATYFDLVLNASLVDEAYIKALIDVNFDLSTIYLMHNFYPRQDTGLDEHYFHTLNETHKTYNLKTMAFVVGDHKRRLPLFEGLPTLEKHRDMNSYCAAVELQRHYGVDIVVIGDNQTKIANLHYMKEFFNKGIITIPAYLDREDLYDQEIAIRQDYAQSLLRLKLPRKTDVPVLNNTKRSKGDIIVDNRLAGRYSGEVQIVKESMLYTARCNNIGWIHPDYHSLLQWVNHETMIRFVRIGEGQ